MRFAKSFFSSRAQKRLPTAPTSLTRNNKLSSTPTGGRNATPGALHLDKADIFSAVYEFIWIKRILRRSPWSTQVGYDRMVT